MVLISGCPFRGTAAALGPWLARQMGGGHWRWLTGWPFCPLPGPVTSSGLSACLRKGCKTIRSDRSASHNTGRHVMGHEGTGPGGSLEDGAELFYSGASTFEKAP